MCIRDSVSVYPAKNKDADTSFARCQVEREGNASSILKKYKITLPYFLCTATLEPRKNIPLLIRAFNDFKSKTGLPHQLVLVGKTGWKAEAILKAIENSNYKNDIIRPGYVESQDLPALYSAAEVFVYPSKYEGFGLPILEAMACGAPVLISRVSSLPEVGGSAAEYFSPDSQEELSQKMIALCSNTDLRAEYRLSLIHI